MSKSMEERIEESRQRIAGLSFDEVLSRSSLGGYAWCSTCKHPDLLHQTFRHRARSRVKTGGCQSEGCECVMLVRMTPSEWLEWRGHK